MTGCVVILETGADTVRGTLCVRDESGATAISGQFEVARCSP